MTASDEPMRVPDAAPTDDELLARLAALLDRVDLPPTFCFAHRSGGSR